ncbi:MAG TPA: hypothetical protein VHQ66_02360 [Myxococcota bacterium]|nr:hypothetical protein [Myxococcota bacterium]
MARRSRAASRARAARAARARTSRRAGATLLGAALFLALASGSCSSPPPPRHADDLCALLAERDGWWDATEHAAARWGIAPGLLLAIIHQESGFRAQARASPRFLGVAFAPASSAYGYPQATSGAWRDYQRATGRRRARPDRFGDAVDFVGWYADLVHRSVGVAKGDAYRLYLGYHEGPTGLRTGTHAAKPWLLEVARRVQARAVRFEQDAAQCGGLSSAAVSPIL